MLKKRVIDTHCDTLMHYVEDAEKFKSGDIDVTYDKMGDYETYLGTFAMYFSAKLEQGERLELAKKYISSYKHMLENYDISPVRTKAELAALSGRGSLLSIENACYFEDDAADLATYWNEGVRMISMTHFMDSQYGNGNAAGDTPDVDMGLTERGKKFVSMVEDTGMILDVSHLSFKSFWHVCEVAKKPFIASHSNSHFKCDHNRNLKDDMIKEIVKRGGLIGLCFCPPFVGKGEVVEIAEMVDHVEHMLTLGAENAICLGGDLDGIDKKIVGLEDCSKSWNLAEAMLERGISEEIVEKIMWGNAYTFMTKMLPEV